MNGICMYAKGYTPAIVRTIIQRTLFRRETVVAKQAYHFLRQAYENPGVYANDAIAYQREMLDSLLKYAAAHCPYYRRAFARHKVGGISDFQCIPLLSKADVRANAVGLCSDRLMKEKVFRFNTGGSTGEPLEFYAARQAAITCAYHHLFTFELCGYVPGDRILAFDGTRIPERASRRGTYWLHKSACDIPYGKYHVSSLFFKPETSQKYIDFFLRLRPQFLRGYPSFISQFAREIDRRGVKVVSPVKAVHLTSENILESQVREIKRTFNCGILRQYGHSEMGLFAFTKADGQEYWCSPFFGLTEILDGSGRHVSTGQTGEVVMTGLHNRGMPLIRYRTGDEAVYGGSCGGFTILQRIVGRSQDYILDRMGNKIPVTGVVFGQHFRAFRHISKWQIVQRDRGTVVLRIVKTDAYSAEDETEIKEKLTNGLQLEASIKYVPRIELTKTGKHRFVVNELLSRLEE